jgi:hypothetical protein
MLYFYLFLFLLSLNYINCLESVKLDYYYEVDLKEYNQTDSVKIKDIYNQSIIKVSKETYNELL